MLIRQIRYWLRSGKRAAALEAEIQQHIEERAADLRNEGLSESEARAEARRRFGNIGLKQQDSREVWIARYWSDFWQDLRYASRSIGRDPGFAVVAILSAGLGIGACSTVFSIVNTAIFRPLPVQDPDRLMAISAIHQKEGAAGETMSFPEIRDIRKEARSWQGVAAFSPFLPAGLRPDNGDAQRYWGFLVTANYFDVVKPSFIAGRGFIDGEDDKPGAPAKIVLTHRLWSSLFGSDPNIVGRTITVNKRSMTVVGITGAGFRGTEVALTADFFLPFSQVSQMHRLGDSPDRMNHYGSQWLFGLGRLKPDVALQQVRSELNVVASGIRERAPGLTRDRGLYFERAGQLLAGVRRIALPAFLLLLTASSLVLLTVCANIANLMLARASSRSKEIATRLAIGAGRGRLVRQLITESVLLGVAGGALGVVLAIWAGRHIGGFRLPVPLPVDLTVSVDYRVILFSVTLSILTGIAVGLAPAYRATRPRLMGSMRSDAVSLSSLRRFGLRNILVVTQLAISAMLVICSGLFLRSLGATRNIDLGMNTSNLLLVRFDPALLGYDERRTRSLLLDTLRSVEAQPGIKSATVSNLLPLSLGGNFTRVQADRPPEPRQGERTAVMVVAPRYFETMGIPFFAGSDFANAAASDATVIVNQELARRLYGNDHPVGRWIYTGPEPARIIAVVANSKYQLMQESEAIPILYRPILDSRAETETLAGLTLVAKTTHHAPLLAEAIRRQLLSRDPEMVVNIGGTMESHLEQALFVPRLAASLFGLCGGIGLLIASIGVYGVVSFAVAKRAREIGIRMALGARSSQVLRMVLWRGFTLASIGIVIGLAGGLAMSRAARSLIFGVSETDPVTFIAVPLVLLFVALLATAVPARRAAMLDPNTTLRSE